MIGFVEGKIEDLTPAKTYINVNGVGYEVNISLYTYEAIKDLETTRLYTHIQVREDAWVLFGFYDFKEKEVFLQLVSVSGVGATTARVIISSIAYKELMRIVANGDNKRHWCQNCSKNYIGIERQTFV
jgi:Holliday junction DNA helicase RuvA